MSEKKKLHVPGAVRWLHTYLSLVGFATIFFFAVTGLTLNHAGWFESGGERRREEQRDVPPELLPADRAPDLDALAGWARASFGLRGDVGDAGFDAPRGSILFKGPGYSADVEFDATTRRAELRETRLNAWALLDDLHKGRDSGGVWAWVIDVSAVVIGLSALTGIWLLFYVKRRRAAGTVVAVVGLAVMLLVAWLWTP